jgi:large subunit ribosomal protein L24
MHVKSGDTVQIIAGKDRGKRGKIRESRPKDNRVVVEGLNLVKRHMKPRGPGKPGGIIEMEAAIHASNVMLVCDACGYAVRTGHRFLEETDARGRARKVRYCKRCDAVIDKE